MKKRPHSSKIRTTTKRKSKVGTIKYALTPEEMYKLDSHQLEIGIEGYQIPRKYNDHHQCVWARKREKILKSHKHVWPPEDWPRDKDDENIKVKPKRKTFLDDLYKWCYSYYDPKRAEELIERGVDTKDYVKPRVIDNYDRPRNDKELLYTDKFYELLFSFAKHNNYGFHPMVSSHNIHLWQKNLNWWKEMTDKYQMRFDTSVMMLEVRNDDWTDETIKLYCEFIQTLAEDFLIHECHNDIKMFGNITGNIRIEPLDNTLPLLQGYYPWCFGEIDTFIGCTISNQFAVRIGDLAICPCHRTAYDKYLYGHFKVENDKIVGITARNPQMAIQILMGNIMTAWPKCDTCLYNSVCMHGCLGSQLEAMHDPFVPIPSVCKLFKAKYSTLINWYKRKGIVDYWKSIDPDEYHSDELAWKLNFIDMWEREQNGMGES